MLRPSTHIGPYRMSARVVPHNGGCIVTITSITQLPSGAFERILAGALGRAYARWCVRQMAQDLVARFA